MLLYREGILASGEPVEASVDSARVAGAAFTCQACHRRSGFGSIEGSAPSPPIVGDVLFAPRHLDRAELHRRLYQEDQAEPFSSRVRDPRLRPAFDTESLAALLRTGHDPTGRELDPWMPRYPLSDVDVANLAAYLRRLGQVPDPGVDEYTLHFATVLSPALDAAEQKAFLDVLESYVRRKNAEVDGLLAHPGSSPWNRDPFAAAFRHWQLHVWQLDGAPSTWGEQLRGFYEQQPVFAVLSGLVPGSFAPVHAFCEQLEVPCLFANTDLPVASETGDYTLNLSRGLVGEAETLAAYLRSQEPAKRPRIVQVSRDTERSRVPAEAFAAAWGGGGLTEARLEGGRPPDWSRIVGNGDILIAWLSSDDLHGLDELGRDALPVVYLSTSLAGTEPPLAEEFRDRVRMTHRFSLPGHEVPRIYRVRAWLLARGIASPEYERLQLNTHLALTAADHALTHLVTRYDRDFFVESVEHEVEDVLNPGTFPRMSLGPGQRFASKGCWIVRFTEEGLEPVTDWLIR